MKKPKPTLLLLGIFVLTIAATVEFALTPPQKGALGTPPTAQMPVRQYGRLNINVERGIRVAVGNRTTGRITINGWDRDAIEVHAVSQRGEEVVIVNSTDDSSGKRFFFKADYADLGLPAAPTQVLDEPPKLDGRFFEVHLEVNVPRYAEIELIQVMRSNVEVSGVETPVSVSGGISSVILKKVGTVAVHTKSGNVEVSDANGLVEVATTSGAIRTFNTEGAVRAVSIAGPIEIKCARGRIDVANTEAPIELINIDGDVDAIATNSSVRFTGEVREGGRYYLKSMSGRVEMILPANTHGFNAMLSSYRGLVETDFSLNTKQSTRVIGVNRRLVGRFGNGQAHITLDSFEGLVRLTRVPATISRGCK